MLFQPVVSIGVGFFRRVVIIAWVEVGLHHGRIDRLQDAAHPVNGCRRIVGFILQDQRDLFRTGVLGSLLQDFHQMG